MKFIYSLLLTVAATITTQAQTDKFTHRIDYTSPTAGSGAYSEYSMRQYLPEKYSENAFSVFNIYSNYGYQVNTAMSHKKFFMVENIDFENNFKISNSSVFYSMDDEDFLKDEYFYPIKSIQKTQNTNNVLGNSCTYYDLIPEDGENNRLISLCIDTKNSLDNASYFLPNQNLKGLVMEIKEGDADDEEFSTVSVSKISKVNVSFTFDFELEKANLDAERALRKEEEEELAAVEVEDSVGYAVEVEDYLSMYNDPLCSYYNEIPEDLSEKANSFVSTYMSSSCSTFLQDINYDGEYDNKKEDVLKFFQRDSKSYTKNLQKSKIITKEEAKKMNKFFVDIYNRSKIYVATVNGDIDTAVAVDAIDYAEAYDAAAYDYVPYESTYKETDLNELSLAVDQYKETDVMLALPTHCGDFKTKIPTFDNKELAVLLGQYVGQSCDLYLTESYPYTVAIKTTIDSLRKSILGLEGIYDTLNKTDKKKLNEFLNSLD